MQQDVCDLRVSKCRGVAYTYLLDGHAIEVIGNCGGTQVVQNAIYIPQLQDQEESGLRSRREVEQIIQSPHVQRDMSDRSVSKCRDREIIDEDFKKRLNRACGLNCSANIMWIANLHECLRIMRYSVEFRHCCYNTGLETE